MALSYIGPTIWSKTPDMLKRTNNLNTFKNNLKEHYLKELKHSSSLALYLENNSLQPSLLLVYTLFLNRHYSTFDEGPQCKYKQFYACIVLSCHQRKCYVFVNFDNTTFFDILLVLFTLLIFNLVFNHFFVIFHIFFGKCTLSYIKYLLI